MSINKWNISSWRQHFYLLYYVIIWFGLDSAGAAHSGSLNQLKSVKTLFLGPNMEILNKLTSSASRWCFSLTPQHLLEHHTIRFTKEKIQGFVFVSGIKLDCLQVSFFKAKEINLNRQTTLCFVKPFMNHKLNRYSTVRKMTTSAF